MVSVMKVGFSWMHDVSVLQQQSMHCSSWCIKLSCSMKPVNQYVTPHCDLQVEKAPLESYADVGGLEQQVIEIKEAVELPLTHPELYQDIGIKPPKVGAAHSQTPANSMP